LPLQLDVGEVKAVHRHVSTTRAQPVEEESGHRGLADAGCAAEPDDASPGQSVAGEKGEQLRAVGGHVDQIRRHAPM
jgi:hypothetical protein